jgi:hypothetical protein
VEMTTSATWKHTAKSPVRERFVTALRAIGRAKKRAGRRATAR